MSKGAKVDFAWNAGAAFAIFIIHLVTVDSGLQNDGFYI